MLKPGSMLKDVNFTNALLNNWVKELKLSYYKKKTLLFTVYSNYGNLFAVP